MSLNETSKKNFILELALEADNNGRLFRRDEIERCRQTADCHLENTLWKDYRKYLMEQFQNASSHQVKCQGLSMSVRNGHYLLTLSGRELSVTLENLANQIKVVDKVIRHVDINSRALTLSPKELERFKGQTLREHKNQLLSKISPKDPTSSDISAFATGVTVTSIFYIASQLLFQRRW